MTCSVHVGNTNNPAYGAYYDGPNYNGSRMSSGSSVSSHAHSCDWVMSDPRLACQASCSFTVTGILPAGVTTLNLRFSPNAYGSSSNIKINDINGDLVHDGSWQDLYIPQYFDGAHWFVATAKAYSQYGDGTRTADGDIYVGY